VRKTGGPRLVHPMELASLDVASQNLAVPVRADPKVRIS
jgi:hypothetical protein